MEDEQTNDEYDYEYEDDEDIEDDDMAAEGMDSGGGASAAPSSRGAGGSSSAAATGEDLALRDETVAFVDQAQLKALMRKVVADIRCDVQAVRTTNAFISRSNGGKYSASSTTANFALFVCRCR